jgi:hypothetical protein
MRSLITGIAEGSGSTRVLGGTVQTFTPVSKGAAGAVAIVEVDQPFAVVVAQTSDLWSTLRLVSAVGLVVSLLLLGLTFVSSKWPVRAQEDDARTPIDEPQENDEGAEMKAQGQQPAERPPTEKGVPTYAEVFGQESDRDAGSQTSAPEGRDRPVQEEAEIEAEAQPSAEPLPAEERALTSEEDLQALDADLDEAVDEQADEAVDDEAVDRVEALEAYGESQESMGQWPEEFRDMVRDMARGGDAQTQEMRQRREEFKNRAKQAELRLKKQEAELHEAPSAPSAER